MGIDLILVRCSAFRRVRINLKKDKKLRGFDIQVASETEAHSSCSFAGEIDGWEPIKNNLPSFDVQSSESPAVSRISYAGIVKTWIPPSSYQEERQWVLACWVMGLLTACLFCGLMTFLFSGNGLLLTGSGIVGIIVGVLTIPVKRIFDHYFRDQSSKTHGKSRTKT